MAPLPDPSGTADVPGPVTRIAGLMSSFPAPWALCGGWAVDAWLGRETRGHGDIDITVFENDADALFGHLAGWRLIAHDTQVPGDTQEPWDGRALTLPAHIHGRPPGSAAGLPEASDARSAEAFDLEIIVNERSEDGEWLLYVIPLEVHEFRREPLISLPLERCVQPTAWGIRAVTPEVLLFYKATAYAGSSSHMRDRDRIDFENLRPTLTPDQRAWLAHAISLTDPNHPWLGSLSA